MRKIVYYAITLILLSVTVAGIIVGFRTLHSQELFSRDKTVTLRGTRSRTERAVSLEELYPGALLISTIHLKADPGDRYALTLQLVEDGETPLADYIDIELRLDGETVGRTTLRDCLNGQAFSCTATFAEGGNAELELRYSMDETVGDEAQGTAADFLIILDAERGSVS